MGLPNLLREDEILSWTKETALFSVVMNMRGVLYSHLSYQTRNTKDLDGREVQLAWVVKEVKG